MSAAPAPMALGVMPPSRQCHSQEPFRMFAETIEWRVNAIESSIVSPPSVPQRLASLFSQQMVEQLKSDVTIFREGDAATHVFEVVEGLLRIVKILTGGRRVITGFVYPGDILGISLRSLNFGTAEALTPTKIRRLSHHQFRQALKSRPELHLGLVQRLCEDMAAADDRIVLLARKTAEERVCSLLLMIARRLRREGHSGPAIEIPMCRLDMADYLGLTKETVCRAMSRLASLGMIKTSGRHVVVIRLPEQLAHFTGDVDGEGPPGPARRN
jgi:CRP/FNR family transcriptional regulator